MDRNSIIAEAISRITSELIKDQTDEQFCILLEKFGLNNLIPESAPYFFDTQKNGNIIMFGDSQIKMREIYGCLKAFGISKDRFEHIPYEKVTNYNFRNLEYNNNYRLILIGPMPHSAKGMGDNNSIIEWLTNNKNIAKTRTFENLKVTKSSFKDVIREEIESGYLLQDL
ncbi:hypothetical protein [uncultured Peptoniphilus sp.]|uniref:hypothetical protein n=1 Tax=uncultured Peptoniphilus sp. TaxID=254354 RepID=UPI00258F9F0C|nr:hypothetical protein [uncultured Peptoniphilus sp.]MDU6784198.1 hypothetical protein [Peptoniphilus harei]